jgi:glycosyltransferase involved in cell wall biosynthesis
MKEKKKILVIADHPLAPSGVGTQTKYVIDTLLRTGEYKFICLGGAVKHPNYDPQNITDPAWDDGDWIVYPVDGYGNAEIIRSLLWAEKPDLLWFMTDPRFFPWLWQIENEVRANVPMLYYHVWDNYPPPKFNRKWYESTDVIASISKVTHDIVSKVAPSVENHYIPHAVDSNSFKKLPKEVVAEFKDNNFPDHNDRTIFFWNNRNARRKQTGTLVNCFNKFAEKVGPENVCLIMHTDPKDPNGQDIEAILSDFGIADGRVLLSRNKMPPEALAMMYNMADCTINISDAEGFGLATLESMACGTPIIVNMTGGLQEQVTDGVKWFGIGLEPESKALIGSQVVPYIYEDRLSEDTIVSALEKMYNMGEEKREALGALGMGHVQKNYNFKAFQERWIELIADIMVRLGSWETRKGYKTWELREVA